MQRIIKTVIYNQGKRIASENIVSEIPEFFARLDLLSFTNSTTQRSGMNFVPKKQTERNLSHGHSGDGCCQHIFIKVATRL